VRPRLVLAALWLPNDDAASHHDGPCARLLHMAMLESDRELFRLGESLHKLPGYIVPNGPG
jgi:hypothetical protein